MADPYKDILAVIDQNKKKTEAIADLERQCQNLQDSTFQHYIVIQEKDRELAKLQLELEQNKVNPEIVEKLTSGLQNLQNDGTRQLVTIQEKEQELMRLQWKLDGLIAKQQEKKISEDVKRENYRTTLAEIRSKLKDLNLRSTDLGKAVDKYDERIENELTEVTNYEKMKVEHHDMKVQIKQLDEKIRESQKKFKSHTDKLAKENEALNSTLKELQKEMYERSMQLKSVQNLLTLSQEKLERIGPGCWRSAKTNTL